MFAPADAPSAQFDLGNVGCDALFGIIMLPEIKIASFRGGER